MALLLLLVPTSRDFESENMARTSSPELAALSHARPYHARKLRSRGDSSPFLPRLALSVYFSHSLLRVELNAFAAGNASVHLVTFCDDSQAGDNSLGKTVLQGQDSVIGKTMEPLLIDRLPSLPGVSATVLEPQEMSNGLVFARHCVESDVNCQGNSTRYCAKDLKHRFATAFDCGKVGSAKSMDTTCTAETLDEAIRAAEQLLEQGTPVSVQTYCRLSQVCTQKRDLAAARWIHSLLVSSGLDSIAILGDHLIRLFDSCGSLLEADMVFNKVAKASVYTWHAIISAHAAHGEIDRAFELYYEMELAGVRPNKFVFTRVLNACSSALALEQGRLIHQDIIMSGLEADLFVGSSLVDFYAKCGRLQEARRVFDRMPQKNVVTWTAMIMGYAQQQSFHSALDLIVKMSQELVEPNEVIFSCILKCCGSIRALREGSLIHGEITKLGLELNLSIRIALVYMYAKCSSPRDAHEIFGILPEQNLELWNTMIAGYVECGHYVSALDLFEKIGKEGPEPDKITFSCILKACAGSISRGMVIHDQIIKAGLESEMFIASSLVDLYCKCGSLPDGKKVFDQLSHRNVVSWGALIAGYVYNGECIPALDLFRKMQESGITPNEFIFSCVLNACGTIGAIEEGGLIHDQIIRSGFSSCVFVQSSLVDMYAKCGSLEAAQKLFDELCNPDIVSWGALINGYTHHGHPLGAVQLFEKMHAKKIVPDKIVFLCVLEACGMMGAIGQGKQVHEQIIASEFESDVMIGNTLIEMYGKCGSLEEAQKVFNELKKRNVVSWGAMIAAYVQHGNCELARHCFEDMLEQGFMPDGMMYTTVLAACSHAGQVEEGQRYFRSLKDHGMRPSIEHFGCMVDLLGQVGQMSEAEDLLETMSIPPDATVWMSLLTASRTHGRVAMGRRCFEQVVRLDPSNASGYVLMSNIYADAELWESALKIQELRKRAGTWKKPARAWIEIDGRVHEFLAGDKSHPQSEKIYANLRHLTSVMKSEGYMPQLGVMVEPMVSVDKEEALLGHSEKLAISFGLLATPKGTTIRVTKNLRMCSDCHHTSGMISRIEEREIIINDAYRLHRFMNGVCSCGDHCG